MDSLSGLTKVQLGNFMLPLTTDFPPIYLPPWWAHPLFTECVIIYFVKFSSDCFCKNAVSQPLSGSEGKKDVPSLIYQYLTTDWPAHHDLHPKKDMVMMDQLFIVFEGHRPWVHSNYWSGNPCSTASTRSPSSHDQEWVFSRQNQWKRAVCETSNPFFQT